jgi:LuxR family maltose regulon positive regulatory protein
VLTLLRTAEGRVAHARGDVDEAVGMLARAVDLGRVCGDASQEVLALTALAQAQHAAGNPEASAAALAEARDTAESEWTTPTALRALGAAEARIGRTSSGQGRRGSTRPLVEELTERELSILRALQGQLSQREIGAEMYLSLNTVKGYTKSLYRKLDVSSRQAAIQRGRALGLI